MKGEYPNVAIRPNVATLAREWFGSAVSVIPPAGDGYYGESRYGDRRYKGPLSGESSYLRMSLLMLFSLLTLSVTAAEPAFQYQSLDPAQTQVPQTLLGIVHTPEVQDELRLTGTKLNGFLPLLKEIDGPWWRARILPEAKQREVTAAQEELLIQAVAKHVDKTAVKRLRQIELQSQGYRCLMRPELVHYLAITESQRKELQETFDHTDSLLVQLRKADADTATSLQQQLKDSRQREFQIGPNLLTAEQQEKLKAILGKLVDPSKFDRIYPLAPELIDSGAWHGDKPVKLEELKGQVVLVHFYAFQCSNCIANFPIYNRWHDTLTSKGVRVIGIQTPETKAESDANKVMAAAKKDGFKFPVLIDLKHENWNAWSNTMWPTVYVIDKRGYIRFWWQGELNWKGATTDKTIEKVVDRLLMERL